MGGSGIAHESLVILIAYNGPFKYSSRNGDIGDPGEVNFVIIPKYFRTVSEKSKDATRRTYPSGKQYLPTPETKEGRKGAIAFIWCREGVGSWGILKRFGILLIKIRIMED